MRRVVALSTGTFFDLSHPGPYEEAPVLENPPDDPYTVTKLMAFREVHRRAAAGCNRACELAGVEPRVEDLDHRSDPEGITAAFGPTLMAIAEAAANDVRTERSSVNPTSERLDYHPMSFDEGIDLLISWVRELGKIQPSHGHHVGDRSIHVDGGTHAAGGWYRHPERGPTRSVLTAEPRPQPSRRRAPMSNALSGIRVVEVAAWTFVPAAGAVLADWGADVIKVEHPELGDPQRGLVSMGLIPGGPDAVNYIIEQPNRGKRSIGLDISTDRRLGPSSTSWSSRRTCSSPASCPTTRQKLQDRRGPHPGRQPEHRLRPRDRPGSEGTRRRARAATTAPRTGVAVASRTR